MLKLVRIVQSYAINDRLSQIFGAVILHATRHLVGIDLQAAVFCRLSDLLATVALKMQQSAK